VLLRERDHFRGVGFGKLERLVLGLLPGLVVLGRAEGGDRFGEVLVELRGDFAEFLGRRFRRGLGFGLVVGLLRFGVAPEQQRRRGDGQDEKAGPDTSHGATPWHKRAKMGRLSA
jgi:hypothetical protein